MPFCSNCGNELGNIVKFCSNCGVAIKASEGQELVPQDNNKVEISSPIPDLSKPPNPYISYDFEKYFGRVAAKSEQIYLSENIPLARVNSLIRQVKRKSPNADFLYGCKFQVYLDEGGWSALGLLIATEKDNNSCFLALFLPPGGNNVIPFSTITEISIYRNVLKFDFIDEVNNSHRTVSAIIRNVELQQALVDFYKAYFDKSANSPITTMNVNNPSPIKPKDGAGIR